MLTPSRTYALLSLILLPCICLAATRLTDGNTRVEGVLRDFFPDPTNPEYVFFYVQETNDAYYVAVNHATPEARSLIEQSVGAQVTLTSWAAQHGPGFLRPYTGRDMTINDVANLTIVRPPQDNLAAFPDAKRLLWKTPDKVSVQDFHRVRGKVIATWSGNSLLLKIENDKIVEAHLRTTRPPRIGETIDIVGLPETTLYHLRLNRATWQSVAPPNGARAEGEPIAAARIVTDERGRPRMDILLHGKTLRVRGVVRRVPRTDNVADDLLYIEDDGFLVAVNGTAAAERLKGVQIGCTVEATGVCVMDVDIWRPNAVFPMIRGYTLVTRFPDDIRVLSRPPWLTPARMLAIVLSLVVLLVVIVIWNRTLKVLVERRGRQLAKEQILRAESDLKVHERTRLAVELHDSLSQTLTGVSMEIRSADKTPDDAPDRKRAHLALATKAIDACREELRHCLWDLRNNALEAKDMNEAIRQTLTPHLGGTELAVRFNVPRTAFTDNTAHAILRIVRELTANAIRHGHATEIHVAGAIENGKLLFSVRDNGCGFDADRAAGPEQGHFGLQGIRERINTFDGEFMVESTPGHGTKATIRLNVPHVADTPS